MATPRTRRVCVFCGGGPLSKEHVYPQWLRTLLINDPRGYPGGRIPQIFRGRRWMSSDPLAFIAQTVCEPCNNGWMSEIESSAIPHLTPMIRGAVLAEGQDLVLDEVAQTAVANWMALRTLIMASTLPYPWPLAFTQWFEWFYSRRTVPPQWHIWIGAYVGILPAHYEVHNFSSFPAALGETTTNIRIRGILTTSVLGYLAYKVIGFSQRVPFDYGGVMLARIFPPVISEVRWPPDRHIITDDTILNFYRTGLTRASILADHWDEIQNA